MRHDFEVRAPDAGRRLDRFVQGALGGVPTSLVQRLLRQKKIRLNGVRARADQRVQEGDVVVVHHVASAEPAPARDTRAYEGPPIEILHEDASFLLVAKPAGVSCSDDGRDPAALAVWLAAYFGQRIAQGEVRPQPCHRLDRGTTGVVAIALTVAAFDRFRVALANEHVHKEYEVAVWGAPEQERWTCEIPLVRRERVRGDEPRVVAASAEEIAAATAWPARTEFAVLVGGEGATLLGARLRTGRTHQVRAHCCASGWPVVGDPRYGAAHLDRGRSIEVDHQLLHARRLQLRDAEGRVEAEAPWPPRERRALRSLGLDPR